MPAHGTTSHESAEKPVTGAAAVQAKAAAVKAAGGGTATAVTTDFTGTGYEVTVKKTNGTTTEIHLDSAFKVVAGGRGGHGPGGPGAGGPHPHLGPPRTSGTSGTSSSSSTTAAGSVTG
jgi:hypothetical protein